MALGLAAIAPFSAFAANDAWSTSPVSANFSGTNWTTGATVAGSATGTAASGDALYFGTSTTTTLTNDDSGYTFAGFTFNSGASAFTIGGNSFTSTGAILNNSTSLQTINNAISFATQTVNAASGAITLGGTLTGSGALTVTGPNAITLSGSSNSVTGLTLGTAAAANSNQNVAVTGESGVTLNLSNSQSLAGILVGAGANVINVGAGAAITSTTLAIINSNDRFDALNINLGSGASMTTTATNSNGLIAVGSQFNIVTLNGTDFATNSSGTMAAASYTSSTSTTVGSSSQNTTVVGDVTLATGATTNTLRFGDTTGHTVTVTSGNLALNGSGSTGGAILMSANSGAITNTITGGNLTGSSNRGLAILNYDTTSGSNLEIDSNINNALISGSGVTASTSVFVAGGGLVTFGGTNIINGALMVDGSTLSVGSDANLGGFNNTVSVASATNGSTTVTLSSATATSGNLVVGDVLLGQIISNISGTTVTLASAYTGTTFSSATTVGYVGGGSVNLNGGTLKATGTFSMAETNNTGSGTTGLSTTVRNRNLGLGLKGGTIDVTSGNTLTVSGVISASTSGTALNKTDSGTLTISGSSANTNIALNANGGTVVLDKTSGVAATTATVASGATLKLGTSANNQQLSGALAVNGGTFDLNGNNSTNSTIAVLTSTGGTITNNGTSNAVLYVGNGGATVTDASTIASTITDGSTNKLSLYFQGNASTSTRVITLSGANSYSGGTTVNAGTVATTSTGTLGNGNVTLASSTGVILTLANTASIASSAILTFGTSSVINLNYSGTDSIAGVTDSSSSTSIGAGTYAASDLNTFFGVTSFTGTGTITVVPGAEQLCDGARWFWSPAVPARSRRGMRA
ncbi:MAG: hypothetical protein QM796_05955 [Chthoniobacteraceae bacterium]